MAVLWPLRPGALRLLRWCLNTIVVLWGVSVLAFVLTALVPGDLAETILSSKGIPPTAEMVAQVRTQFGLDRPVWEQYLSWLEALLRGDLGTSLSRGTSIAADFAHRVPLTLALTAVALAGAWLMAVPLALAAAARRGGRLDRVVCLFSYAGSSVPAFVVALWVLDIICLRLRLLPIAAEQDASGLVMPALTMVLASTGWYVRQIRTIAVEEYQQPYVDGLRVRGTGEMRIARHVLRSIAAPLVALAAHSCGALLGGTAVVESIFSWQGLGQYALGAISAKDYPVIQAYVLWCALVFLSCNAVADLAALALDPRLAGRRGRGRRLTLPQEPMTLTIQHVDVASMSSTTPSVQGRARRLGRVTAQTRWLVLLTSLLLLTLVGALGPLLVSHDPYATAMDHALRAPAGEHLLGTDVLGRDVLARVLAGMQPTLVISLSVVASALVVGTVVGVISGMFGGMIDALLQRITAVFQSFPEFILALAVAAMLRPGSTSAVLALTAAYWPKVARYARILTMQLVNAPFVHVARMNGMPTWRLVLRHLVPHIASPLLVLAASDIGSVILNLATLSFVGLGMPQPTADWGTMISDGRAYLHVAGWLVAGPGLALFLVVLCCNLFADASQDLLSVRSTSPSTSHRKGHTA